MVGGFFRVTHFLDLFSYLGQIASCSRNLPTLDGNVNHNLIDNGGRAMHLGRRTNELAGLAVAAVSTRSDLP